MKPLIGITCSRRVVEGLAPDSTGDRINYTFEEYSKAIRQCGGSPVLNLKHLLDKNHSNMIISSIEEAKCRNIATPA